VAAKKLSPESELLDPVAMPSAAQDMSRADGSKTN